MPLLGFDEDKVLKKNIRPATGSDRYPPFIEVPHMVFEKSRHIRTGKPNTKVRERVGD